MENKINYYKVIDGLNFDAGLLNMADELIKGQGDGRISIDDSNKLLTKIKERIDSSREGSQRTSYRVYATTYEEPHIFCVKSSAMIQGITEENA
mgnify:CR=1 FL=1